MRYFYHINKVKRICSITRGVQNLCLFNQLFYPSTWCCGPLSEVRVGRNGGTNFQDIDYTFVSTLSHVPITVGLNLNFEFESAHELLMNLNSTFAKSMNLNLVFQS